MLRDLMNRPFQAEMVEGHHRITLHAWEYVANRNGNATNDALGQLNSQSDLGTGLNEGLIAKGDSGGPAFIQNKIAGIASYTSSLSRGDIHPDVDTIVNSSFGEIAAWQRVSAYQQWIDQSLRANYLSPPTKPEEVKKEIKDVESLGRYTEKMRELYG